MSTTEARFEFGTNWNKYVHRNLTEERIEIAKVCLLDFLGVKDLKGVQFLDIGCGSGVHSLAAHQPLIPVAVAVAEFDWVAKGSPAAGMTRYLAAATLSSELGGSNL